MVVNFMYFRSGLYGEQLKRYFSLFPKQQFHVIKFRDFIADPIENIGAICKFLGVDANFRPELEVSNAGKVTARFPKTQYYIRRRLPLPKLVRKPLMSILKRVNRMKIPPIDPETRRTLLDRYAADLQLLDDLTGISFSAEPR